MIFNVYTRLDGAYVLVPECMTASLEAQRLHGPLEYCDRLDSDEHPFPGLWELVVRETDEHSFAVLQEPIGKQLLGIDCPNEDAPKRQRVG